MMCFVPAGIGPRLFSAGVVTGRRPDMSKVGLRFYSNRV